MSCVMSAPSATRFCTMSPTCQMTCRQHVSSDIARLSFWGSGQHADIRHLPTKAMRSNASVLMVILWFDWNPRIPPPPDLFEYMVPGSLGTNNRRWAKTTYSDLILLNFTLRYFTSCGWGNGREEAGKIVSVLTGRRFFTPCPPHHLPKCVCGASTSM